MDQLVWSDVLGGILTAAIILVTYVYIGYPLLLGMLRLSGGKRRHEVGEIRPWVTLIIPAYNERKVIREKLENSLKFDYPADRLEILVASDGSEDGTNEVVREYEPRGVKLLAFTPRGGKISVLNRAIPTASGEIVVLCDANVMFLPDALTRLVRHFAQKFARQMKKPIETIPTDAMSLLCGWAWPGNVRELENAIERAVIQSRGSVLQISIAEFQHPPVAQPNDPMTLDVAEREHILRVLRETDWIIGGPRGAAVRLGMKRTTLNSRMQKLGISRRA